MKFVFVQNIVEARRRNNSWRKQDCGAQALIEYMESKLRRLVKKENNLILFKHRRCLHL